jgi:hypothetical protein
MVSGYNNILTLAKSGMRFGKNDGVNHFDIITHSKDVVANSEVQPTTYDKPQLELYLLVISLIGGSLVSKFII